LDPHIQALWDLYGNGPDVAVATPPGGTGTGPAKISRVLIAAGARDALWVATGGRVP